MAVAGLTRWLLLATAIAVASPTMVVAQPEANLSVRVTGAGRALPGARVTLDRVARLADRAGLVRFTAGPGAHRLVVAAVGWIPDTVTLVLAAADTSISIELSEAPAELETLIVTTARTHRRIDDEAIRVEVLDTEEIDEKQLMTPGDIVMMLNETGGVRAQTTNPSLGGAGIRIRGLRGRYTQVLADGLPLFGERIGAFGPLQIPPIDLRQVEIIKGVASALFGGSALGGVVNLISRPPSGGGTTLLNATSLGGADLVSYLGRELSPNWGVTALVGGHTQPKVDRDRDGWADVAGYRRAVVRPRLFWHDSTGQSFLATVGATVESRTGGTLPGRLAPDGLPFEERVGTTRVDGGLVGRWRVGAGRWLQLRSSGTSLRHEHQFGPVDEPDRHVTWFAEAAVTETRGQTELLLGAAISADRYRSERLPAFDFAFTVPGIFVQADHAGRRGAVAASVRLDHHSRYGTQLSPRVSGLVKTGSGWSLRGSLGAGFFGPTPLVEETERTGLARLLPLGTLRAERAVSASIDVRGMLGPLEANLSAFTARIAHAAEVRDAATALPRVELVNAVQVTRSSGADLSLVFRRSPFAVIGSYAFVATSEPEPNGTSRRPTPLTPRHTAGLVAVAEGERGRIGLELYYTGRQSLEANPYRSSSEPYLVLGLLAERRFGRASLFVNFENLTDVRQTKTDPLIRPFRAPDGNWTVDAWGPLDGRVVNGGVRWTW